MKLSSSELRKLVSEAVPGNLEFSESDKPDGRFYASVCSEQDEFAVSVDVADLIHARFGVPRDDIRLSWDAYNWTYSAEF